METSEENQQTDEQNIYIPIYLNLSIYQIRACKNQKDSSLKLFIDC